MHRKLVGTAPGQTPMSQLTAANLASLMEQYQKCPKDNRFTEAMVEEERNHLYYEETRHLLQPELRDLNFSRAADIDAFMQRDSPKVPNDIHLGLHKYPQASNASPFERFAVVSPTNEQFGYQARMHMNEVGIRVGDMLEIEKRIQYQRLTEERKTDLESTQSAVKGYSLTGSSKTSSGFQV